MRRAGAGDDAGAVSRYARSRARRGSIFRTHGLRQQQAILSSVAARRPACRSSAASAGSSRCSVNLVDSARDAGGRSSSVAASAVEREGRPLVRICGRGVGPGIAPDVLSRLFVGFVTTKARGKGTGLGLRICRRIVEEMDRSISASNRAEGGACLESCCRQRESSDAAAWSGLEFMGPRAQ